MTRRAADAPPLGGARARGDPSPEYAVGAASAGAFRRRTSCCTGATGRRAANARTRWAGSSASTCRSARMPSVTLWVDGRREVELRFSVPAHVAARNGLATGVEARVSLLRDALHFMPYEPLERLPAPTGEPTRTRTGRAARIHIRQI